MINVLVLGSKGQLGQSIDFLKTQYPEINYLMTDKDELDLTNPEQIKDIFNSNDLDWCINCAAYTAVDLAEAEEELATRINTTGVKLLAESCKQHHVNLIHISTDYVFNGEKKSPYKITDPTSPINAYGRSKLGGELALSSILERHYIIRTSWLYSCFGKNFLNTILTKLDNGEKLNIITSETGTPTNCIELARFVNFLIIKGSLPFGIYHFTAQGTTTWFDFALEIARNHNPSAIADISPVATFKTKANRPKYSVLDTGKTEALYQPLQHWKEGVKQVVELSKTIRFKPD